MVRLTLVSGCWKNRLTKALMRQVKIVEANHLDDTILQYEKDFFSLNFCSSRVNLENRLTADFIEYGSSGAIYNRESIINALVSLSNLCNAPVLCASVRSIISFVFSPYLL